MTPSEMAMHYYPNLWDIQRINQLLTAKRITAEEYTQITGKALEAGKDGEV